MPNQEKPERYRLDVFAHGPLSDLVERFRELLLSESATKAGDRPITANDLEETYRYLVTHDRRTMQDARDIVSIALRENRAAEWVAYGMAVVLFVIGVLLLLLGGVQGTLAGILGGGVAELLLFVPLRIAINIRRHNIKIRIFGKVLDQVNDPRTLARLLKDTFPEIVSGDRGLRRGGESD